MSPDTSAQGAPVASQEAEARGWDVIPALGVEWARYDALPVGDSEERQLVRTRIVQLLLHAWEPSIRASERERYAALVEAVQNVRHHPMFCILRMPSEGCVCGITVLRGALAALEEAENV